MISPNELSLKIDHTNLKPTATTNDIKLLCKEAIKYKFINVCVNPVYASLATQLLENSQVGVCVVVGFPLGASTSKTKSLEAEEAVKNGASELDLVINLGMLKSGRYEKLEDDIRGVVDSSGGKVVKAILETALLNKEEKIRASLISVKAGARFVKTSTGFGDLKGATIEDVKLLKNTITNDMGVKASGGIRDLRSVLNMLNAGADRIGTSSGVQIMQECYRKVDIQ